MNKVLVVDKNNKPLKVMFRKRAMSMVSKGKAYVHAKLSNKVGITVIVIMKEVKNVNGYNVGIDLGETEGYAIVDKESNEVVLTLELQKRTDIKSLMESRKSSRRLRRSKLWYRKPKFKSCQKRVFDKDKNKWVKVAIEYPKSKNWLPPTILSKINISVSTIKLIMKLLPIEKIIAEIGQFDVQALMSPEITGVEYQSGEMKGYDSIREFVLIRDEFKCHYEKLRPDIPCGGILEADHVKPKSKGGSDRATNRVCACHNHNQAKSNMYYKEFTGKKPPNIKDFKAAVFMNVAKDYLLPRLKELGVPVAYTYGYITRRKRRDIGLEKSHVNDAIAIAVENTAMLPNVDNSFFLNAIHFRKKKRSLHEETPRKGRKEPNKMQKRNSKNTKEVMSKGIKYCIGDVVRINVDCFVTEKKKRVETDSNIGYITGFDASQCYIKRADGKYLQVSEKYPQVGFGKITILRRSNNLVIM